jgi:hypothetical protein
VLEAELGHGGAAMSHAESWFSKHGFRRLPFGYRQPPIGGYPAVPMHLLFKPKAEGLALTPQLQLGLVRALFEQKYAKSYGVTAQTIAEELRLCAADLGLGASRGEADRTLPKSS